MKKKVPFSVSRGDARSLAAQVADGLREAIVGGYYKPGDVVPTSRELAPMLGVSRIVTIAALEKLCAEGFIVSRPRIGSVVVDRSAKRWNGHVVLVYEKGDDNYLGSFRRRASAPMLAADATSRILTSRFRARLILSS